MTPEQSALWERIKAFDMDDMGSRLKFSDRLARDNGWSMGFALRIIDEYKKFMYLCCTLPNGATPSDAVDQVWHLHMIYTRSYWLDFCKNTLKRDIHHGPTKGGAEERAKYDDMYSQTVEGYAKAFGIGPPQDIWPPNKQRFSDVDFERVNKRTNWVIPKPGFLSKKLGSVLLVLLCAGFIQAEGVSLGSLIIGFVVSFALIFFVIAPWMRRVGERRKQERDFRNAIHKTYPNAYSGTPYGRDKSVGTKSSYRKPTNNASNGADSGCSVHGTTPYLFIDNSDDSSSPRHSDPGPSHDSGWGSDSNSNSDSSSSSGCSSSSSCSSSSCGSSCGGGGD